MSIRCKLVILILALTLDDQVRSGEIVGGHEAAMHSRPYMVLLELHTNGHTKHCGGFLLSNDFVMTAAHCEAESYNVLLGVHNVRNKVGVQNVSVKKTFPHKGYNKTGCKNDMMLLQLSSEAQFNKNVSPIALARQTDGSLPESCTVSGWGRPGISNKYNSLVLMEVDVTLTNSEFCAGENVYCSENDDAGPAKGDSGGPLVCGNGEAYGVVSSNKKPETGPTVHKYTKIPDNREWIDYIMTNN